LKVAGGVILIVFFSLVVIGAIAVAAIALPGYRVESGFIGRILGLCFLFGLSGLFMCMVGAQLVRKNISESCRWNAEQVVNERRWQA
jgi:phosphate/sulfate permease